MQLPAGSYSAFEGLMQSSGCSLHISLQWRIGKTTVSAGAKNEAHADDQAPCTPCHNPHADNRFFLRGDPAGAPLPPSGEPAAGR